VWFKDEGGRDKCIEVVVDLMDADGRRVRGQEVPLKVSLLYEDMHVVTKQDILKLSSDTRQYIDDTGVATLRLRIEDVSKNHQSKGFVIKVAPDTQHSPLNDDISPDISTSINVRSKRNRRNKGGNKDDDTTSGIVGVGHSISRGSIDLAMPVDNPLQDSQLGGPPEPGDSSTNPMHKALSSVVNWTRAVVNGLYQIQWQLIGYETKPDGTPDISRPLFNITNPNAIVTSILQAYRNDTMDNLRFMVQALENAGQEQDGMGGPPFGSMAPPGYSQNGNTMGKGDQGEPSSMGPPYGYPSQSGVPFATSTSGNASSADTGSGGNSDSPPRPPVLGNPNAPVYDGPGGSGGSGSGNLSNIASMAIPNLPTGAAAAAAVNFSRPGFARGKSAVNASYLGGASGLDFDMMDSGGFPMLPLVRENTFDLLAGMEPSWFMETHDGGGGMTASAHMAIESQVHFMVAKVYYSNAFGELGFPAFDNRHSLVSSMDDLL